MRCAMLAPSPDMTSSPAGRLHIFHVLSSEAVATMGLLGCIVIALTAIVWPWNVFDSPHLPGGSRDRKGGDGLLSLIIYTKVGCRAVRQLQASSGAV